MTIAVDLGRKATKQKIFCFKFSELYFMSNLLPNDNSKVAYTQKFIFSKKFDSEHSALRTT